MRRWIGGGFTGIDELPKNDGVAAFLAGLLLFIVLCSKQNNLRI